MQPSPYPAACPILPYGLGLPNLNWEQGISGIHLLLESGNGTSPDGAMLCISLEQAQLEIGTFTPFLLLPFADYGHLLMD